MVTARFVIIGGLLASAPVAAICSVALAGEAQVLPDHIRTPGVANPDVTPETMGKTICNPGWHTGDIRPPPDVIGADKIKQIDEYGYADKDKSHYEEDHLIALEVGGNHRTSGPKVTTPIRTQGTRIGSRIT